MMAAEAFLERTPGEEDMEDMEADVVEEELEDDEDGLGRSLSPISIDEQYLGATVADDADEPAGTLSQSVQRWKVQHGPGDFKFPVGRFMTRVLSKGFDGPQALEILQRRCTMNYGSSRVGSSRAKEENKYSHKFHLDFLSIVGRPLKAMVKRGARPFDNVTISLHRWQAPYSIKHARGIPTDMTNRTFRLGESATREKWYIVMHPNERSTATRVGEDEAGRKQRKARGKGTAVTRHHAEALASYIKSLFLDSTLVEQRVEAGWKLGGTEEKTMAFNHWVRFQTLFMERWPDFMRLHGHDGFWKDNQPAFHAYDYGANMEIEVTERLRSLGPEVPLRPVDDEDDDDSAGESESESDTERIMTSAHGGDEEFPATGRLASQSAAGAEEVDSTDANGAADRSDGAERGENNSASAGPEASLFASDDELQDEQADDGLYSEGLKQLRVELEQKYNLDNIDAVSYALAVNIKCASPGPPAGERSPSCSASPFAFPSPMASVQGEGQQEGESLCLLADRNRVSKEYASNRDFTFYSLGFHPAYGNFASAEPPRFLANGPLAIMKDNMSYRNDGAAVLEAGYWQAYSNIKSLIRHTSEDLLATRGSATAALTIPATDAGSRAQTRKTQQRLLERIRGGLTPDNPAASIPFARERQRVEAAIAGQSYDFRLEQVLSVNVKRLVPEHRSFATVLHPIFGLMRFFLQQKAEYLGLLRQFPPVAFPGVLAGFGKVFELALKAMEERFRADGSRGLDLALSEGVAALDRLGNFCFTGDPTVLPTKVLRPLKTVDSLRDGGWPFVSPEILDIRDGQGLINLHKWPRKEDGRPVLMHVASLAYHYGEQIATNRESQLWFSELGGSVIRGLGSLSSFVEEIFRKLWKEDMKAFVSYQVQQRLNQGIRGGQVTVTADRARITEARMA